MLSHCVTINPLLSKCLEALLLSKTNNTILNQYSTWQTIRTPCVPAWKWRNISSAQGNTLIIIVCSYCFPICLGAERIYKTKTLQSNFHASTLTANLIDLNLSRNYSLYNDLLVCINIIFYLYKMLLKLYASKSNRILYWTESQMIYRKLSPFPDSIRSLPYFHNQCHIFT